MPVNKNAAQDWQVRRAAGAEANQDASYPSRTPLSRPNSIRASTGGLREAVAVLILRLQNPDMPSCLQRGGWRLVESWLPEIVAARHGAEAT